MANEDDMIKRLVDALERNARLSSVSGGTSSDLNGTDSLIAKAKQSAAALDKLSMGLRLTTSSQRKYNDALYKNTRVVEQLEEELENLISEVVRECARDSRAFYHPMYSYQARCGKEIADAIEKKYGV
jgi:hypothetical protein